MRIGKNVVTIASLATVFTYFFTSCAYCSCWPDCACWAQTPGKKGRLRSSPVLKHGTVAPVGYEIPCLRCRCKLDIAALCDHCQAELTIKKTLKSFGNISSESVQAWTTPKAAILEIAKRSTKSANEIIIRENLWQKRNIASEPCDKRIPFDKLKLQHPTLPKVKQREINIDEYSLKEKSFASETSDKIPLYDRLKLQHQALPKVKQREINIDEYSLKEKSFSSETSNRSVPYHQIELQRPVLPEVKQRGHILQKSTLLHPGKQEKAVKCFSDDSIITSFLTSFARPGKEGDLKYVFPKRELESKKYSTPVCSSELIADILQKEQKKIDKGEDKTQAREKEDGEKRSHPGRKGRGEGGYLRRKKSRGEKGRLKGQKRGEQNGTETGKEKSVEKGGKKGREGGGEKGEDEDRQSGGKKGEKTVEERGEEIGGQRSDGKFEDRGTQNSAEKGEDKSGEAQASKEKSGLNTQAKEEKGAIDKSQKTLPKQTKGTDKEQAPKEEANKKGKVLKKPKEEIEIVRPDVVMYDVLPQQKTTRADRNKQKVEIEKLPQLMVTFPSQAELDLEACQEIFKKKSNRADEFVKNTKLVENLPENYEPLEKPEPESRLFHVTHQLQEVQLQDEYEDEVQKPGPRKVIRYALSDHSYVENGWTQLPAEKVVRKMFIYRSRPAHPEFNWFNNNKNKGVTFYDTGEMLAKVDDTGHGRWYYKNGRIALDYHQSENGQKRVTVYSSGKRDENGNTCPVSILATFDYIGNGIVFDQNGKIRINYNQTEGMVHDQKIGPKSHWKWHSLNDPPNFQTIMVDTLSAVKDPNIIALNSHESDIESDTRVTDDQDILAIELDVFAKEVSKRQSQKFCPYKIRFKSVKINQQFSLKIVDQTRIYLQFRDGLSNLKMNLGIIIDPEEVVDTEIADVGSIPNCLLSQAHTDSMILLQNYYKKVKKINRRRSVHESRVRNPMPVSSADRMLSGVTRPLYPMPQYEYPLLCTCPGGHTPSARKIDECTALI